MQVGTLLPQGVIITFCYNIGLLVSICKLYYIIHKFFVFVYYFYILLDEFELLYTIHKGYLIMWNSKEVMDVLIFQILAGIWIYTN